MSDIIDSSELRRGPLDRLAAVKDVLSLFPYRDDDRPLVSDLIALADYIATGTADVAQGNDRVMHQNYENRRLP